MTAGDPTWARRFAQDVIDQVAAIIPPDVMVSVEGEGAAVVVRMSVERPRSRWLEQCFGSVAMEVDDLPRMERLVFAVQSLLDDLQDFVALQTTTPWPGTGTKQPVPNTEIVGNRVEAWFGDDRAGVTYPKVSVLWEA